MRDIKMKQSACQPKVKELPARMPKEAARLAALEAKEESRRMSEGMYAKEEGESPTGYASGNVGRQIDGNANSELFFRHLSY